MEVHRLERMGVHIWVHVVFGRRGGGQPGELSKKKHLNGHIKKVRSGHFEGCLHHRKLVGWNHMLVCDHRAGPVSLDLKLPTHFFEALWATRVCLEHLSCDFL